MAENALSPMWEKNDVEQDGKRKKSKRDVDVVTWK